MAMTPCSQQLRPADDALDHVGCIGTTGLIQLWSEVLEVSDVEACDDFFNLGGNSLRAIRILAEIARLMNFEFTTRVLYENPTPAAFHARLHELAASALLRLLDLAGHPGQQRGHLR
jgi:hypothetical protein